MTGIRSVNCFLNVGLNETFTQDNQGIFDDLLLCEVTETPEYDPMDMFGPSYDRFGWARVFVSGLHGG